jgi:hypothetical protein
MYSPFLVLGSAELPIRLNAALKLSSFGMRVGKNPIYIGETAVSFHRQSESDICESPLFDKYSEHTG